MEPKPRIPTSTAILIGSAVIAVGLYFGLRGQRETLPAPPPSVEAQSPHALTPQPSPSPSPAAPAAAVDPSQMEKQVLAALEKHRKMLTDQCLKPALAAQPAPATVNYRLNFTFDASGRQIMRGISEDRATARPDVTRCLTDSLPEITIATPGGAAPIEVPFSLP
jgi:hypothetical protein